MDGEEYNVLYKYLLNKEYSENSSLNEKRALRKRAQSFIIKENKLYYRINEGKCVAADDQNLRLVILSDEKFRIISECHINSGSHLGVDKTVVKIQERYYWKGIIKDVKSFIKTCEQCQTSNKKQKTTKPEMTPIPVPPSTSKKIAIDLIGPYNDKTGKPLSDAGYKYVLTVIDFFSNYTEAFPLYTKNASEIAENLYTLFCRHGVPLEMISDNGGEFNEIKLISEKVMENVDQAQKRQKLHFDNRHNIHENEFKENDNVLVKNKKRKKGMEKQNWLGPYKIDKVVKKGTYRIKCVSSDDVIGTFKQMNIKKYYSPNDNTQTVSAEIHFEPNKTQPVVDHHDLDESYESNNNENQDQNSDMNNNNCDVLDGSLFLTQSTLKKLIQRMKLKSLNSIFKSKMIKKMKPKISVRKESVEIRNVNLVFLNILHINR
ncbi:unnamed protein product [Mytilus coruscus]|uniref:Integrase catalytic domain-containing protein n=1 Tax=Mytilus coruscus TaxID=42192 RepID=A0A6J8C7V5_MYTCO|nr:unnamed protein product [Mytilus coruscus]